MRVLFACFALVALSGCLSITPERIRMSNGDFAVQSTHLDTTHMVGAP